MQANQVLNKGVESFEGKATLILINSVGFPVCRHITVKKAEIKSTEYQKKNLQLKYVEKGKRKITGTWYRENEMALAAGWQEIKGAINGSESGEWDQFDDEAFEKMLNQLRDVIYTQK